MKNYVIVYTNSFQGLNKPTEVKFFNSKLSADELLYHFLNSSVYGNKNATVISINIL
jgi:hypothetical protein